MKVTVICFGAMRDYLPEGAAGNRAEVDVARDATVADVAAALGAPGRLLHVVLVNGERTDLSKVVKEGDEVTLMPPFAGG
jgi:molybdopterin converting factor small subunit